MKNIGLIGCGTISGMYMENLSRSEEVRVITCADIKPDHAKRLAEGFGIPKVCTPEELYNDPDVEIILNLTVPQAHKEVNLAALRAGKNVYCEKPVALTLEDAKEVIQTAKEHGCRLACAPDVILGSAIQTAKKELEKGSIGKVLTGTVNFHCSGWELWHPSPYHLYRKGAGPLWDTGIYYVSSLVYLLGSIKSVTCFGIQSGTERIIKSKPDEGNVLTVEVPTTYCGALEFAAGPVVSFTMSCDVWGSALPQFELFGTDGTLSLPDPVYYQGEVKLLKSEWVMDSVKDMEFLERFAALNSPAIPAMMKTLPPAFVQKQEDMHGFGVETLARCMGSGEEIITNENYGYHILETMIAIDTAIEEKRVVTINSVV